MRYSTRATIGWTVVAVLLSLVLYEVIKSGVSAKAVVKVVLLAFVAIVFMAVSRVMTSPDRILNPDLWESLEQLPSRDGKKRRGDVVLRDGRTFSNVSFNEYRLMSVGQRSSGSRFTPMR